MPEDRKMDAQRTPASEPPEAAADGAAGAPPSNTAPGNGNTGQTTIVGAGTDSLYLSVPGSLKAGT